MRRPGALLLALLLVALAARPARAQPQIVAVVLRGGWTGPLGNFSQVGLGFALGGGSLLLGATHTQALQLEPYAVFTRPWSLRSGWVLTLLLSTGDLGGDYRVDRLPELVLSRRSPVAGTSLTFLLELSAGYYVVKPNSLSGGRLTLVSQLTAAAPLGRSASLTGTLGYRAHTYFGPMSTEQWYGSVVLAFSPTPAFSATLTYSYQDAWGGSPLLFDGLGDDHSLTAAVTLRASPSLSLQHYQTYSIAGGVISARVSSVTLSTRQGVSLSVGYDEIPQKLTFSLSFSH